MVESGGLNDRIVKKVRSLPADEEVRKFLLQMLGYELDHANGGVWHYTQDYQREIDRFTKKERND